MRPRALCLGPLMLGLVVAGCRNDEGLDLPTVTGDGGMDAGKGGAGGAVVVSGGGGSGAGGSAGGAGGSAGGGGVGGNIGGVGGNLGAGGGSGAGGATDAGLPMDVRPTCGPVCAIFCPNGNVLDDRGCPTCQCKPPPTCKPVACKLLCPNGFQKNASGCEICACNPPAPACQPSECPAPAPGAPNYMCSDGSVGGPVCERTDTGRCAWIFRNCPTDDCGNARSASTCAALSTCRWLEPGCTEPRLPLAGCYARGLLDCETRGCPAGRQCVKRVINPCADGGALAGTSPAPAIIAPPPPVCTACAFSISLCL